MGVRFLEDSGSDCPENVSLVYASNVPDGLKKLRDAFSRGGGTNLAIWADAHKLVPDAVKAVPQNLIQSMTGGRPITGNTVLLSPQQFPFFSGTVQRYENLTGHFSNISLGSPEFLQKSEGMEIWQNNTLDFVKNLGDSFDPRKISIETFFEKMREKPTLHVDGIAPATLRFFRPVVEPATFFSSLKGGNATERIRKQNGIQAILPFMWTMHAWNIGLMPQHDDRNEHTSPFVTDAAEDRKLRGVEIVDVTLDAPFL